MLTCYDFPTARILSDSGVDILLIGDSVGTNVLGYADVSEVTMADMLHHTAAVARGAGNCFVLADMPFGSFATSELAVANAQRLVKAGADGVKMEGEHEAVEQIRAVAQSGISVCAHIGYTPQTDGAKARVQGRDFNRAIDLIETAYVMEQAGAIMLVLELIPMRLAGAITSHISIPTIGIGAGPLCSGQVQVVHDVVGLSPRTYRHARAFGSLGEQLADVTRAYCTAVRDKIFPTQENASTLPNDVFGEVQNWIKRTHRENRS